MHAYSSILLFSSLVAVVLGAPAQPNSRELPKRSFSVKRAPNPHFAGHNGAAALRKAYVKWDMDAPPNAKATNPNHSLSEVTSEAAAESTTGSVPVSPVGNDLQFVSEVTIGGQTLHLDFDTGSADLWVFNTNLPAAEQGNHTIYDFNKSKSFKPLPAESFLIKYGDGSGASGSVGADTVVIGGITVTSQAVGLPTAVSNSFVRDAGSDGLLGLSFNKLSTVKPNKQNTFFDNTIPSLPEPVFTASLKHGTSGSYDFGVIDSTKFNGPLSWATVNQDNGFWEVTSSQFAVDNGAPIPITTSKAIIDTGTTLMIVNPVMINAYYSQVAGAQNSEKEGGIVFPCSSELPDLHVDIGGSYMAKIPGSLINFSQSTDPAELCFGGLQASDPKSSFQIFGDVFLKAQFVAFHAGNGSVGLAPHN